MSVPLRTCVYSSEQMTCFKQDGEFSKPNISKLVPLVVACHDGKEAKSRLISLKAELEEVGLLATWAPFPVQFGVQTGLQVKKDCTKGLRCTFHGSSLMIVMLAAAAFVFKATKQTGSCQCCGKRAPQFVQVWAQEVRSKGRSNSHGPWKSTEPCNFKCHYTFRCWGGSHCGFYAIQQATKTLDCKSFVTEVKAKVFQRALCRTKPRMGLTSTETHRCKAAYFSTELDRSHEA
eukprot:1061690-Amphidinium_carterae.1